MLKYSKSDLFRYYGNTGWKSFARGWRTPGFRYIFFFRLAGSSGGLLKLAARLLLKRYSIRYGIQIPYNTAIGEGFYIGHFGTIVVNSQAVIGRNCNIAQGVTIGQANRGKGQGVPVLGDEVWIGANAVIVGNVKIGNDVLIAPNAYVNFDVPDHSIVIGNPGTIRSSEAATAAYINRKVG